MRKSLFLTLILGCIFSCFSNAQYVDITDPNFRTFLQGRYPACFNTAGQMDTTCTQIVNTTYLDPVGLSINNIDELVYFKNLTGLWCDDNLISQLPALPRNMQSLRCKNNRITQLPTLPRSMTYLDCDNNMITEIPAFSSSMNHIYCRKNTIRCLPKIELPDSYLFIHIDVNTLACIPNYENSVIFDMYDSAGNPVQGTYLPLCNATNNIYNCQAFPIISGIVYNDANSNSIKDNNEPSKRNLRVTLSNGKSTYTDDNGKYEITADSIGNQTISLTAPDFYEAVPPSYTFDFGRYDTTVAANFALRTIPIVLIDKLSIKITPLSWIARPGFPFVYNISYHNIGTSTLNTSVVFNYDNSRLNYDSCSNNMIIDNGNSLSLNISNFAPCQSGSYIAYFRTKPTVPIGDTINAYASISGNTFTAYDTAYTPVRGSHDPNDKQATPQLSPLQVASGKYIDYTIRFQNTGTDTAFNIVISDTLNSDLQAGTLEMLLSSHNCKATVKDNIAFFEFLNIQLPDSNVNEPKSHGFVSFRIQPKSNVAVNTTIPNSAAIYFDYNAPVITNTAGTLIKDFITVPLKLISFSAAPQNDNTIALYWNTANEINCKQFLIERGNDGLRFNAITSIAAKGMANNNYTATVADNNTGIVFYRLKMIDNDGRFTYSHFIKIDRRKNTTGIAALTNPVKDMLFISSTDRTLNNTQVNIINSQGAVIKTFIVKNGSQSLSIKELPNGVYYLRTVNGSSRIVKQ